MGLPRSSYVQEGQEGVFHCFSRCVRRAFLCGVDALSGRDFSHRKAWLVDRLRFLAASFAIEVCAYAIMANHYHTILRTRPNLVASWSDREVAARWLTIFPRRRRPGGPPLPPLDEQIRALADCPERIAKLRLRLSSLSWFMARLNEFIARAANKEDDVKGRFWESRFKCQALLDEAAIAACMVYVDLNPIRAGLAATPEESDFTSIQERIRAWQKETMTAASDSHPPMQDMPSTSLSMDMPMSVDSDAISHSIPDRDSAMSHSFDAADPSASWLCPIASDSHRRGILQMTAAQYFDLVDRSGRLMRPNKQGAIDADLAAIIERIGAKSEAWRETISRFASKFRLAAGTLSNLRHFAQQVGRQWFQGVRTARAAFTLSLPQWT